MGRDIDSYYPFFSFYGKSLIFLLTFFNKLNKINGIFVIFSINIGKYSLCMMIEIQKRELS
jgi:hypothetical protein